MIDGREIAIALLEEAQKDLQFELRDIDWSIEEIAHGVRPRMERQALVARQRRAEAALERTKRELHEMTGAKKKASQNGVFCDKSEGETP